MWKMDNSHPKYSFEELIASFVAQPPPADFIYYPEVTTEVAQLPACLEPLSEEEQKVLLPLIIPDY